MNRKFKLSIILAESPSTNVTAVCRPVLSVAKTDSETFPPPRLGGKMADTIATLAALLAVILPESRLTIMSGESDCHFTSVLGGITPTVSSENCARSENLGPGGSTGSAGFGGSVRGTVSPEGVSQNRLMASCI